jgi:hypothetical protein
MKQISKISDKEEFSGVFEIPTYLLRAYALFYVKYGLKQEFSQKELDWVVGESMKKKIFALLLKAGWIAKKQKNTYVCLNPETLLKKMVDFKVPFLMKNVEKPYCFTGLSAIEIWSDYSYVQRSWEKSPYFIKVLKKDLTYWKTFFNKNRIPNYVNSGRSIGEFIILIPVEKLDFEEKDSFKVEKLNVTRDIARNNKIYLYPYNYMKEKYG